VDHPKRFRRLELVPKAIRRAIERMIVKNLEAFRSDPSWLIAKRNLESAQWIATAKPAEYFTLYQNIRMRIQV
jgi:hypothetical protein